MAAKNQVESAQTSLFQEHNPYWSSSLFNDVYLRNDVPRVYSKAWDADEGFEAFQNAFHNLATNVTREDAEAWSEPDTLNNWIIPILEMLGWQEQCATTELPLTVHEDGKAKTYRLDLAYVGEPKFKKYVRNAKAEDRLRETRDENTGVQLVVEAKYWDRLEQYRQDIKEDKRRLKPDTDDGTRSLSPDDQIIKYLEVVQRNFGILTDGKTWRLYHRELSRGDVRRHFEFDIGNLADFARAGIDNETRRTEFLAQARYFYFIFRKASMVQDGPSAPLLYELLEYSKKYAFEIEENLKQRFIEAMGMACNAYMKAQGSNGAGVDLSLVRNAAESHLFNILFIRSCETRKILPVHASDYLKISLTEIIESLDHMRFDPDKDIDDYLRFFKRSFGESFRLDGYEVYERLISLYVTVQNGSVGFGIPGFKESIFEPDEWKFAQAHKIDNRSMLLCLFNLNFVESNYGARKYQQIAYSIFTPRQLGSIYESFLEFKLERAATDMAFVGNQWRPAALESNKVKSLRLLPQNVAKKGSLFFTPDNDDRKVSGSYYTPDDVVRYIVDQTVGTHCRTKSSAELAKVRICDPAMGSGHFLTAALQALVARYREALSDETLDDLSESFGETARTLLGRCIFGVDANPRAVKLAKMSMWLATALPGKKLERLDDNFVCGDSLEISSLSRFRWKKSFSEIFAKGGFDFVVGNPPYIRSRFIAEEDKAALAKAYALAAYQPDTFAFFIEKSITALVGAGRVGFILPSGFLTNDQYAVLRRHLVEKCTVEKIVDLKAGVFKEASVDTFVLVVSGAEPKKTHEVQIGERKSTDMSVADIVLSPVKQEKFLSSRGAELNTNSSSSALDIIGLMESSGAELGDYIDVSAGMKIRKDFVHNSKKSTLHKKFVVGRNVAPMSIEWQGLWVPFDKALEAKFSNQAFRDASIFNQSEKVVVRQVADSRRIFAALDTERLFCDQSLYCLNKKSKEVDLAYICGILVSMPLAFYFLHTMSDRKKTFPKIKGTNLKRLPIPKRKSGDDEMSRLVRKLDGSNREKILAEIDLVAFKAFGFSKSAEKAVRDYFRQVDAARRPSSKLAS